MNPEGDRDDSKRYTGIMKWLDFQRIGYILLDHDSDEVVVNVSSFSVTDHRSRTIQEGDRVQFSVKTTDSNFHSLMSVNVIPIGPQCYGCGRIGHIANKCPQTTNSRVRCYRCGKFGHFSRGCFSGFRYPNDGGSTGSVVCVTRKQDVKKVEQVEDCFILDFVPTEIDDDDDDEDDDDDDDDDEDEDDDEDNEDDSDDDEDNEDDSDDDECRVISSIVCVKKAEDVKKVEEVEDCFILEFDPTEPIKFSYLSLSDESQPLATDSKEDVFILAEKGQVACRDYPHPRHICATHPFKSTPHELHCKMCYCYICDIPAPCIEWSRSDFPHSDASADILLCRVRRNQKMMKGNNT